MENKIINMTKWIFLAIGAAMLAGGVVANQIILMGLGAGFFAIGAGIMFYQKKTAAKIEYLKQNGRLINAEFTEVALNMQLQVNGRNPFQIIAQWHDSASNQLYIFKSASIWFDPSEFVQNKRIPVYIDSNNPSQYHMDISFLPKVAG
jgi:hypothetical protein